MSRAVNRHSTGGANSLSLAVKKFVDKEKEFKSFIESINAQNMIMASGLKLSGEYSNVILSANVEDEETTQSYLTEQRNRIKDICKKSVISTRYADCFALTMNDVSIEIQNQALRNQNGAGTQDLDSAAFDYEQLISTKMQEHKANQDKNSIPIDEDRTMRDCRKRLGEKDTRKKSRHSATEEEDDDELEVVNESANVSELKCPITQMIFKNPVRSKVCNHLYEHDAVKKHISSNQGKVPCPIPGCSNRLALDQLERDIETELKVKRYQKKEEASKRQRTENAVMDDDGNEVTTGGTTIIE